MGNKISTYTAITTLANGDLLDISKDMGASTYATRKITYANLLVELAADLTFPASNNLGNSNLTADANTRTYTLNGSGSTNSVSFLNGAASQLLGLRGDKKITLLTSTYATVASVNYDVSLGDGSNGKSFIHYLGSDLSNDFAIKHINSTNGNAMHSVSTGSAPKYQFWNYETSSNADLTIYQSSSNARISLNSPSTATWQTALTFSGQGTELITLRGSNFWFSGIIDVKNDSAVVKTSLRAKRSQGYVSWFGEGFQVGGTDGGYTSGSLADFTMLAASTNQGVIFSTSAGTKTNTWLDNGRYVMNLASSIISDGDLINNSVNLYTDGTSVKARYKNNSGTASDLYFGGYEWSSFTFAEGGTLAYQIINPVDHDSYTNAMGFVVPEACTLDEVSVILGSSSASASETLTFTVRKLAVGTGLTGSASAYSLGAGTSVTTVDFASGGILASKYYRNQASTNLGISLSAGDVLFVESSNFAFWTVADVIVKIKVKC